MSRMFTRSSGNADDAGFEAIMKRKETEMRSMFSLLDPDNKGTVSRDTLCAVLEAAGIDPTRPIIVEELNSVTNGSDSIDFKRFSEVLSGAVHADYLHKTLTGTLAIPSFREFCEDLVQIFEEIRSDNKGDVARYIPELANVDPEKFAFAVCTVDGQVFGYGDCDEEFALQSCAKPFTYCLACEEHGVKEVHKWVGREPSGVAFNAFTLNRDNKPHNPMINAGAFITHWLVKQDMRASKRIAHILQTFKGIAGGNKIGFDQPTYLSERETANKNFALGYFMKSLNAWPSTVEVETELEFYFQVCSTTVTVRTLAIMASTLAMGGVCPLTLDHMLSHETVKSCLQLIMSCGMYDYSGEWACTIGLPAKSGVSGSLFVVIPNVMGLAIWSPRLDERGNTYRGIRFCERLTEKYSLSIFDQLMASSSNRIDPTAQARI